MNENSERMNQSIFNGRMLCQNLPELAEGIHKELKSGTIIFKVEEILT